MKIRDNIRDKEFQINNRRYLGSKERLLTFIDTVIKENTHNIKSVADIFAGTGVVANMFASEGKSIIINDILHSNHVIYKAFFGTQKYDYCKIDKALKKINNLTDYGDHYLEKVYGNRYFSEDNAAKIGSARQWIEDNKKKFNDREKAILITSILYGADKVANTVGHYDAYRKRMDSLQKVTFKMPYINNYQNTHIYMMDANKLVKNINADLVYIDPPYNSRQYVDTYHVLENIADWNEPEVKGIARKSTDRKDRKSQYNLVKAPQAFDDLITHINSKYILVSFNNMAHKGAGRSNSKISHDEIMRSLKKRGKVRVFHQDFNPFTTGKTNIKNHKELLYLVKIK